MYIGPLPNPIPYHKLSLIYCKAYCHTKSLSFNPWFNLNKSRKKLKLYNASPMIPTTNNPNNIYRYFLNVGFTNFEIANNPTYSTPNINIDVLAIEKNNAPNPEIITST